MFGSCESIFGTSVPRKTVKSVSSTELQMMEMEIVTDLANVEIDSIKASTTMSQLDQLLNMYNHVKKFGIDRTFLSLYNSNNQLNNMLGVKFPSCESADSEGYPGSNISKTFLVAMEDENEGILAKIGKGLKWIWEKIKHICSVVWDKIKSWIGLGTKKNKVILDKAAEAVRNGAKPKSIKRIITKKRVAATVAVIAAALVGIKAAKEYNKFMIKKLRHEMRMLNMDEYVKLRDDMYKQAEETYKRARDADYKLRDDLRASINRAEQHADQYGVAILGAKNDLDKTDARVAKLEAELARIKREEKTETIDNPSEQQTKEIIDTTQNANAELEKTKKEVDPVIKELEKNIKDNVNSMRACHKQIMCYNLFKNIANKELQTLQKTMKTMAETNSDVCKQTADIQKELNSTKDKADLQKRESRITEAVHDYENWTDSMRKLYNKFRGDAVSNREKLKEYRAQHSS